ncbi:hypothetical protein N431DRAFT_545678 [Stipitochalara longipes BDJ]|nr:hypothetical protein N431DRAFT_545678 [Stipitochalara longipes BDJ]
MTRLQMVWPKDGPKGSRRRGFFHGFNDILTGKGPDMFLQRHKSSTPINPERWGNWDSYHDVRSHFREEYDGAANPCGNSSRGLKRYDPHTRKYRNWLTPTDWAGGGVNGQGIGIHGAGYPRFTGSEGRKMFRRLAQGRRIDPSKMGKEWNMEGPRRFRQEHDWFWQEAHGIGENRRQGLPFNDPINSNFFNHQQDPWDLPDWVRWEVLRMP